MRAILTPPSSIHYRAAARIASRPVLPVSVLSVALFGAPARGQSQLASASTAAALAASSDFSAEYDCINNAKSWVEYRYAKVERTCYGKFLVTCCINKAKNVCRTELHSIHERESVLDEAERADRAAHRDQEYTIREAQYNVKRPQRGVAKQKNCSESESKQEQQRLNEARHQAQAPQRVANAQVAIKKQVDYDAKLKAAQEQDVVSAAKRAESAKQFQEKQQDVAKRQKEPEERREQTKCRNQQNQNNISPLGS